jgi:hypothetical protein
LILVIIHNDHALVFDCIKFHYRPIPHYTTPTGIVNPLIQSPPWITVTLAVPAQALPL